MAFIYYLFFGIFGTIISTSLPGLLNMYSAKISMNQGKKNAFLFATGVSLAILIETLIALVFARFLDKNPDIITILQKVVLGVFISMTIYFFFIAKDVSKKPVNKKLDSKRNLFFRGFILSAINLLPIPYWVYISITFSSFKWFSFSHLSVFATVLGSAIGAFIVMAVYIWFFRPKENQRKMVLNMNYLIGTVTAIISVFTLIKIIRTM
ncbi:MAG: threonine/homoserine/homoserine lactone efflux protein [bacterium]|jgi:threonine/homoserine/homoserine lactone efflux protein